MEEEIRKIKETLRRNKVRVNDRLGQNFLVDLSVPKRMAAAADVGKKDLVLEVGPGLGVLTKALAKRAGRVLAVELDPGLARLARQATASAGNVEVVTENILYFDYPAYTRKLFKTDSNLDNFKVVSSLPYYVTTPIISLFLTSSLKPQNMVLLIQQEVAERLVDKSGKRGFFTVFTGFWARTELVSKLGPEAFWPSPKVSSAIVRITPRAKPGVTVSDERAFLQFVKTAFAGRRKQLKNALAGSFRLAGSQAEEWLNQNKIDPARRAETLTLPEWKALFDTRPTEIQNK